MRRLLLLLTVSVSAAPIQDAAEPCRVPNLDRWQEFPNWTRLMAVNGPGGAFFPRQAVDSTGVVHTVALTQSAIDPELRIAYHTNASEHRRLSGFSTSIILGKGASPFVAVTPDDAVHALWTRFENGAPVGLRYRKRPPTSDVWDGPIDVNWTEAVELH